MAERGWTRLSPPVMNDSRGTQLPYLGENNGVPSLPGGPRSHIRHTPFPNTCFLIFLATLFAAWLASDFVPTLYELKL